MSSTKLKDVLITGEVAKVCKVMPLNPIGCSASPTQSLTYFGGTMRKRNSRPRVSNQGVYPRKTGVRPLAVRDIEGPRRGTSVNALLLNEFAQRQKSSLSVPSADDIGGQ